MRSRAAIIPVLLVLAGVVVPVVLARSAGSPATAATRARTVSDSMVTGTGTRQQIAVLTAALARMSRNYKNLDNLTPGVADIYDYGIGALWRRGIDGAGTTIAVLEGWDDPDIASAVRQFDQPLGLPNPVIRTIYPAGSLPRTCPPGMQRLSSYGDCAAWQGELDLDVTAAHLIAPYATILIAVAPADTQIKDDAASQVAPPELMEAVEDIAGHHLANVISVSDGTGESTYSHGVPEITAQDPAELTAAAQGIPLVDGTGDCGVVQNLAVANGQCEDTTSKPSTAAWDDSPWVTAVAGSIPNLGSTGKRLGPDPLWSVDGTFSGGAGFSAVFARPWYQDAVVRDPMREVPDITMDATEGTSEATPLFAGVLALATQLNHGANVGPVNPALYQALGPAGARDGIADVVKGNNSVNNGHLVVRGYQAGPGFDVASGWGTVYAPRFVASLVANVGLDVQARQRAQDQLDALEHDSVQLSRTTSGSTLSATGFLPGHPVQLLVNGTSIGTLTANTAGTVTLGTGTATLAASSGVVTLRSMLITETAHW
jgi:subtilase family serine protease